MAFAAPSPPRDQSSSQKPTATPTTRIRGESCRRCREKKARCDGARPACGGCVKQGLPCEYRDTPFLNTIAGLERHAQQLEARVNELELERASSTTLNTSAFGIVGTGNNALPPGAIPLHLSHTTPEQLGQLGDSLVTMLAGETSTPTPLTLAVENHLLAVFYSHKNQFRFPIPSLTRLNSSATTGSTQALREAAYAVGAQFCSCAPNVHPSASALVARAEVSLSEPGDETDPLQAILTHSLLATLLNINGRSVDGLRHAGAAFRIAIALNLQMQAPSNGPDDQGRSERAWIWWMVYCLDRAWASVWSTLPSSLDESSVTAPMSVAACTGAAVQSLAALEAAPYHGLLADETRESLSVKAIALHARIQVLSLHPHDQRNTPGFWAAVRSVQAAIERLIMLLPLQSGTIEWASLKIIAEGALSDLNAAIGRPELAISGAHRVAQVIGEVQHEADWSTADPLVGYYFARTEARLSGAPLTPPSISHMKAVLQNMVQHMPYLAPLRTPAGRQSQ